MEVCLEPDIMNLAFTVTDDSVPEDLVLGSLGDLGHFGGLLAV